MSRDSLGNQERIVLSLSFSRSPSFSIFLSITYIHTLANESLDTMNFSFLRNTEFGIIYFPIYFSSDTRFSLSHRFLSFGFIFKSENPFSMLILDFHSYYDRFYDASNLSKFFYGCLFIGWPWLFASRTETASGSDGNRDSLPNEREFDVKDFSFPRKGKYAGYILESDVELLEIHRMLHNFLFFFFS